MKIHNVFVPGLLILFFTQSISCGQNTLHTFTSPGGQTLKAAVSAYNPSSGKIKIECENGRRLWTLPTVFCKEDQNYIQQWIKVDQFMSSTKFKIKGDSTKNTEIYYTDNRESHVKNSERTEICYEIALENKTDFPLEGLRIEYRAFIENRGYQGREDSSRVDGDHLSIDEVPVGKTISRTLPSIRLTTQYEIIATHDIYSGYTSYHEDKTSEEQLKGFWVKVYGPELDGQQMIREWCYPSDTMEKYTWQEVAKTSTKKTGTSKSATQTTDLYSLRPTSLARTDPDKALKLMQEKYKKDPNPLLAYNIGYTYIYYLRPPNVSLGVEWLEKAAKEDYFSACTELSSFYSKLTEHLDPEKAFRYGEQVLSIRPDYYRSHEIMAAVYACDNQFEKAIEHQQRAIQLFKKGKSSSSIALTRLERKLKSYQQMMK
jgi:hypothetical protein